MIFGTKHDLIYYLGEGAHLLLFNPSGVGLCIDTVLCNYFKQVIIFIHVIIRVLSSYTNYYFKIEKL